MMAYYNDCISHYSAPPPLSRHSDACIKIGDEPADARNLSPARPMGGGGKRRSMGSKSDRDKWGKCGRGKTGGEEKRGGCEKCGRGICENVGTQKMWA